MSRLFIDRMSVLVVASVKATLVLEILANVLIFISFDHEVYDHES